VERQRNPGLANAPLIVGGRRWDEGAVLDCCPRAVSAGVEPGMRLSRAEALCPAARFLPADEEAYEEVHRALVDSARHFTPTVETDHLGLVYADVSGLGRRFDADTGVGRQLTEEVTGASVLDVQIGVGSGKFVAQQAARAAQPGEACTVSAGEEQAFLSPLDISVLPLDPEMERRLRLLGVRTLGALAKLPRPAVLRQFGGSAGAPYDLACGTDARPVHTEAPPLRLARSHSFLDPVRDRAPLLAHVVRMANDLAREIDRRGYQAEGLVLEIEETERDRGAAPHSTHKLGKPVKPPSSSADHLARLGARMLGSLTLGGPVVSLSLTVYPMRPFHWGAAQLTLFGSGARAISPSPFPLAGGDKLGGLAPSSLPSPATFGQALRETLRRLRDRFGELSVLVASLVVAPAPCPIQVTIGRNGLPRGIVWRERIWGVRSIYEHWRERRRWWGPHPIERDYFRLEIEAGSMVPRRPSQAQSPRRMKVVFRDVRTDRWYLERRHI
jgi:DNA polymerase-4